MSSITSTRRRRGSPFIGPLCAVVVGSVLSAPPALADGSDGSDGSVMSLRPTSDAERARKALRVARRQLGDAYEYGAEGPDRFDCSGLVYFATHRAGFTTVPRTSAEQADHMRRIKRSKLRRGDFVFLKNKGGVYHVGFFVGRKDGETRIVHAPGSGQDVSRDPIWTDKWFAATLRRA